MIFYVCLSPTSLLHLGSATQNHHSSVDPQTPPFVLFLSKLSKSQPFITNFFPFLSSSLKLFTILQEYSVCEHSPIILFSFLAIYLLNNLDFQKNFYKGKVIIIKLNNKKKCSLFLLFLCPLSFSIMCACFLSLPDNCHFPTLIPNLSYHLLLTASLSTVTSPSCFQQA